MATFAAFWPTLHNDFVNWDDDKILYDNPEYRGLGLAQLRWMFTTFLMGHYQPLTWVSFGVDYLIWGMNPFGYHLTSLLLHVANGVLFFFVGRRLLAAAFSVSPQEPSWRLDLGAALAALLFAIHPLRVESVAWATERRDVLSGFFYFCTIYFYLRAAAAASRETWRRWLCAAVAAYLLSLLSKATAMTLPVILLLLDVYPLRRLRGAPSQWWEPRARSLLSEKLPFVLLAVSSAVAALLAQQLTGALKPLAQYDIFSRLLQAGFAVVFYLWKSLWPATLAPIYELPIEAGIWFWIFLVSCAAVVLLTWALYLARRRWPGALASWIYYIVVLAPVSGVAQSGPQLVADRYSYLACLSWPLLIAGIMLSLPAADPASRGGRALWAGGAVSLLLLAVLTWNQTSVWRSAITLWQHGTRVEPRASIAHYNLGRAFERGDRFDQAVASYRRAVEVNPVYAKAHFNMARLLALKGAESEAVGHYRRVIEIRPDHADAHNDLGLLFELRGEEAFALAQYRKAVELDPKHYQGYFNAAELLAKHGELESAVANYLQAVAINSREPSIRIRLAIALARQGKLASAEDHLRRALELKPGDGHALLLLARALAAQGRNDEAERYQMDAVRALKSAKQPAESSSR